MPNTQHDLAQTLKRLQAISNRCARAFTTVQLKVEYRVAYSAGATIHFGWHMFLPSLSAWPALNGASAYRFETNYLWYVLLNDLLFVNFYWGLINLLPVWPLDGGRAARAVFVRRDRYNGKRTALLVSALVAAAVALMGVYERSIYMLALFGILAASSAQMFESERRHSGPRPYRSWG